MPIIVPIEENKVGLATATDARFRAPDYSGTGLQALGGGLTDVGKGGAQLAEALDGLRTHRDDAAIKQAYVGFGNQADPLLHSFFSLNGSAARAALPRVEADLQAAGQAQIDGVGNDRRRAMIAQQITHRVAESVAAARSHAGLQDIADQAQQNRSLQDRSIKDALNNIDRPELYEHHIETGKNAARQQARLAGQPPAQGEAAAHDYQSGIHLTHIDTRAADDAVGALVAVRRHGSDMRPDDMRKALTGITPRFSYERAIADVDAADLAASPFAPQAPRMSADDLRDRMLVISPDTQQGNLPSVLRRYRGDAARSWAAAAMGPDKLDALIAERGDGWYQALPQPVLLAVAQNMALLGARGSARALPADPIAAAMRIIDQPGDDERKQHALDELNWRIARADRSRREAGGRAADQAMAIADQHGDAFTSIAQIPPTVRRDLPPGVADDLAQRARGNMNPQTVAFDGAASTFHMEPAAAANSAEQPGSGQTHLAPADGGGASNQISSSPSAPSANPIVDPQTSSHAENTSPAPAMPDPAVDQIAAPLTDSLAGHWNADHSAFVIDKTLGQTIKPITTGQVGTDMIIAAPVSHADRSRLSGVNIVATPAMRAAAASAAAMVAVQSGRDEKSAYGYLMPDGRIEVRPAVATLMNNGSSSGLTIRPSGPGIPIFLIHGHSDSDSEGMVDAPDRNHGYGDTYELMRFHIPVATVFNGQIGWHEMKSGQLIFSAPANSQNQDYIDHIKKNLTTSQKNFFLPKIKKPRQN
ncbi:MAG: hypothetical protein JWL96_2535 [Sphingomonas bacterium]|uniref:hypothetical protein n=1 Tax=Sphingomonas bacterium TaxID=1895847 RepID=UPI0026039533|nr:hypothetical protein [Sphingomonas bacterium]MDB5710465.1 hypothetical protein [Sphingomonas bacterium]